MMQTVGWFFKTLKSLSESGDEIPPFFRHTPDPWSLKKVVELATEWQAKVGKPSYKVNRDSYLSMIDGVIYGDDPRQGYVESECLSSWAEIFISSAIRMAIG
jgi:predicted Zn-dependent protease